MIEVSRTTTTPMPGETSRAKMLRTVESIADESDGSTGLTGDLAVLIAAPQALAKVAVVSATQRMIFANDMFRFSILPKLDSFECTGLNDWNHWSQSSDYAVRARSSLGLTPMLRRNSRHMCA